MNAAWKIVPQQTACNKNVSTVVTKSKLALCSQVKAAVQPSNGSVRGIDTSSRTADEPDVRLFFSLITSSCAQLVSDRSSDEAGWQDSLHVLKTTGEAPRCEFPCSHASSVHVCWMAEQTDDAAKKLFDFDFAQRTLPLALLLEIFFLPRRPYDCDLFLHW